MKKTWFLLGRDVNLAFPREACSLRPSPAALKQAARALGISVADARRALAAFHYPDFSSKRIVPDGRPPA